MSACQQCLLRKHELYSIHIQLNEQLKENVTTTIAKYFLFLPETRFPGAILKLIAPFPTVQRPPFIDSGFGVLVGEIITNLSFY